MEAARDIRVAARSLLRSPLATLIAVATLTVVVGSNVAVFALVDGVLLRPLPFDAPERLVLIWHNNLSSDLPFNAVSYPTFRDVRDASQTLSQLATIQQTTSGFTVVDGPDFRDAQARGAPPYHRAHCPSGSSHAGCGWSQPGAP